MRTTRTTATVLLGLVPLLAGCGGGGGTTTTRVTTAVTTASSTDGSTTATTGTTGTTGAASTAAPVSPTASASPAPSGSGGTSTVAESSTTAARPADATAADLRGARIASACDTGPVTLVGGKAPAGGRAEGELTKDVVLVDLDGDGAKEALGVYSCMTTAQRPGPAVLVATRSGGRTLGSVALTAEDTAYSDVTGLQVDGKAVVARWESYLSGYRPPSRRTSTVRWTGSTLVATETARSRSAAAAVTDVDGSTEFASPSGNLLCNLSAQGASCTIDKADFTPPADPGCDGLWGHTIGLYGGTRAAFACKQDAWAANDPTPSWWSSATDGHTAALGWSNAPTLGYGHVLRAGDTRCEVKKDSGVTCASGSHGFTLGRSAYRVW